MRVESTTPASSAIPGAVHECDYCGRPAHRATAVESVQRSGDDVEVVTVCVECAVGVD